MALVAAAISLLLGGCDAGYAPIGPPGATDPGMMGCQVAAAPGATVREGTRWHRTSRWRVCRSPR